MSAYTEDSGFIQGTQVRRMTEPALISEAVAEGYQALARGGWVKARSCFDSALASNSGPAALEGLSWVHWWQEDLAACLATREQAYRDYHAAGDSHGAARMAAWIGDDHLWFAGKPAIAEGWFARSRRLLDGLDEAPEHGWLAVFDAYLALRSQQLDTARTLVHEAQRIGQTHGAVGLQMFAVAMEGVVLLERGEIAAGMRCLDEAATAALAGEYEELVPAVWSCCLLLTACEELRDDERGGQWSQQIGAFSKRLGVPFVVGNCRSHYGRILTRRGSWQDAEQELVTAVDRLPNGPQAWRADALARLGDLRRRQGRHAEARQAFEAAGEHWFAQAGLAALHLDADDAAGAAILAERTLRQLPATSPKRADALEVAVRARLALEAPDTAAGYARELCHLAATVGTSSLVATARLCEARLALADGNAELAAQHCADAVASFDRAGTPFEAALARLELAQALTSTACSELAVVETRRAWATLDELEATSEADRATALLAELATDDTPPEPCPLTRRQLEILKLAAEGLTERQVAKHLVLSEHTVHRHLANIYTRLDCSSRAAAVAQAGRLGLL
ncbi:LuxR family transcriptional regulator [Natronospirillum operosum]|nr:LuxR family transcriptional regulator [Natronospirillum operosum]